MAIDQTGKQYNIVIALIGFSSDLGSRFAALEEKLAEYSQAGTFADALFEDPDHVATIGHLNANDVAVLVNAYNSMLSTADSGGLRAAMRKAVL